MLTERAPAKVNLTLHIRGRRVDGYHELESLVAFAGVGDTLRLAPGDRFELRVAGPEGDGCGPSADNLVTKAQRLLRDAVPGLRSGRVTLTKRLPVAAGLGGGSADAAAFLRLLARLNDLALDGAAVAAAARECGADVPVCLSPQARMMSGAGEQVGPALGLEPLFAVLANPRVQTPTGPVFAALGLAPGDRTNAPPHPAISGDRGTLIDLLSACRNDLEGPAIGLVPVIADLLAALRGLAGCRLARMSGSGATCFGLFDSCRDAARAAATLRAARPCWWIKPTILR